MIPVPVDAVHHLAVAGLETVAGVASRWDVIGAAFVGGFLREWATKRRDRRETRDAIRVAVASHVAACPLRSVAVAK